MFRYITGKFQKRFHFLLPWMIPLFDHIIVHPSPILNEANDTNHTQNDLYRAFPFFPAHTFRSLYSRLA